MIEHRSARSAAMKAYNHLSFQGVISRRRGIRRSSDAERLTSQRVQAAGSHRGRDSVRGVARDDRLWAAATYSPTETSPGAEMAGSARPSSATSPKGPNHSP